MDGVFLYKLVNDRASVQMHPAAVAESQVPPFSYYMRKDHEPIGQKGGASLGEREVWNITSVADTYAGAASVSDAIRAAIDNYSGTVTVGTAPTAPTARSFSISQLKATDQTDGFDDEAGLFMKQLEITIINLY